MMVARRIVSVEPFKDGKGINVGDKALWYASAKVKGSKYVVRTIPTNDETGPRFEEDVPTVEALRRLLLALRPRWGAELVIGVSSGMPKAVYGESGETREQVVAWGIEKVTGTDGFAAFILDNQDYESLWQTFRAWREAEGIQGFESASPSGTRPRV